MAQVQCRVYFVQDVHRRRLELQECEDEGEGNERSVFISLAAISGGSEEEEREEEGGERDLMMWINSGIDECGNEEKGRTFVHHSAR